MRSFAIIDIPNNQDLLEFLQCSSNSSYQINCLKLLLGLVNINAGSSNKVVKCRRDFLKIRPTNGIISNERLLTCIFGDVIKIEDAEKILNLAKIYNVKFFKEFMTELTHCLFCYYKGHYVESFLHYYRTLEKISVAFPLIYISSESDFFTANSKLATFFKNEPGELKFISRFAEVIATENDVLSEVSITFKTNYSDTESYENLINQLKIACPNYIDPDLDYQLGKFDIPFAKVPSFLISCRNRTFHFGNDGKKNIDIDRIDGSSEMCRMLTEAGLHWLAISYVHLLQERLSRIVI